MELSTGTIVDDISNWSDLLVLDLKTSGFSNNTILMYTRVYKKFSEFLNKNYPTLFLKDIKSLQLKEFVLYMEKETQKSKSTKETYVKALRKLFIFISDNNSDEYTFDHVIRSFKIISEKKTHEKIKSFNPKETDRFMSHLSQISDALTYENLDRVKLVLLAKLMFYSALRISEALNIRFSDIVSHDKDFYIISITGKGGEKQQIYILKEHIDKEILILKKDKKESSRSFIFTDKSSKKITRNTAYYRLAKLYSEMGINRRGCHILRHSMAMYLTRENVSLVKIKKILRHENIITTTKYAKALKDDEKEVAKMVMNNLQKSISISDG